jgi:hypothetical protein
MNGSIKNSDMFRSGDAALAAHFFFVPLIKTTLNGYNSRHYNHNILHSPYDKREKTTHKLEEPEQLIYVALCFKRQP